MRHLHFFVQFFTLENPFMMSLYIICKILYDAFNCVQLTVPTIGRGSRYKLQRSVGPEGGPTIFDIYVSFYVLLTVHPCISC